MKIINSVCFVLACIALHGEETDELNGVRFTYDVVSDGARILKILSISDQHLELPTYVRGLPIVEIGESAFRFDKTLTKEGHEVNALTLPRLIKRIRAQAFYSYRSSSSPSRRLTVVFPATLEVLDRWSFGKAVLYSDAGKEDYRWLSIIGTAVFEGQFPTIESRSTLARTVFQGLEGDFGDYYSDANIYVCAKYKDGFPSRGDSDYLGGTVILGVSDPVQIKAPVTSFSDVLNDVTISAAENAVIRYTTNGQDPGIGGEMYEKPFWLCCTTVVRATATEPGMLYPSHSEVLFNCLTDRGGSRTYPVVLSSAVRQVDSTVIDIVYYVVSDKPTVNVRALAFEDGERSFWKVVRPETFVKDANGNETAQNIGDGIAANVEHKLAWKVSADWKTDLAKVKFEVLTSEMAQLPLKTVTIPAVAGKSPSLTVAVNSQSDTDIFNALLWHYADAAQDLELRDGRLYRTDGVLMSDRNNLGSADRWTLVRYLYDKMGWEGLENMILVDFVQKALRNKNLWFNSSIHNLAILKGTMPTSFYIGEKAYWAIDLETGTSEYFDSVPLAGWDDVYKTTKLLMRRIEPGDVKMGGTKPVTLTKPFYIGVFEVTQKQYALINGSNPSQCKGDMRPVEYVSYNDIRGTSKGAQWPNGAEFDDMSWLGKLKAKVGVAFDLPTESQWEYACRAGTTTYFNNGGSGDGDLNMLGRYSSNRNDGKGGYSEHTTAGSYLPNAWGLYDMHGNVYEWCLDWYGSNNSDPATDWAGAASGSYRVLRGGSWNSVSYYASSGYRNNGDSSPSYSGSICGFRLGRTLENE